DIMCNSGTDATVYVISASNNADRVGANPADPGHDPIHVTTTEWYTLKHRFYNDNGVLACQLSLLDAGGALVHSWVRRDPSDLISGIGGNRYGWFAAQELPFLAIDNSARFASSLGSAPVVGGVATLTLNNLSIGSHTLIANYTGDACHQGSVSNKVAADVNTPAISIADVSAAEGNSGTTTFSFTVSLSSESDQPVTVQYQTADGTATTANSDYLATSGTLTIPAKTLSGTIQVSVVGDHIAEPNETFFVNLSNPTNATIGDGQGVGTILNDDTTPQLDIQATASVMEGNSGTTNVTLTATLSNTTDQTVTVNYATHDGTAKASNNDYVAVTGVLTIPPKTLSGTITVTVNGDVTEEGNETFTVVLTNPANATLGNATATVTILNDDNVPALAINDVTHQEGNTGGATTYTFTVSLSNPTDQPVSVHYQTADGTATEANFDYVPASGTLTIPPKTILGTITIQVRGDAQVEPDETFFVNLSSPTNATIADGKGQGTIENDDQTADAPEAPVTEFALSRIVPNPTQGSARVDYTVA